MRGEQAIFNLEIKKKSGLSFNPDIHHSKVFSSVKRCQPSKYAFNAWFERVEDLSIVEIIRNIIIRILIHHR